MGTSAGTPGVRWRRACAAECRAVRVNGWSETAGCACRETACCGDAATVGWLDPVAAQPVSSAAPAASAIAARDSTVTASPSLTVGRLTQWLASGYEPSGFSSRRHCYRRAMTLQQFLSDLRLKTISPAHRAIRHLSGGRALGSAF